jgi:hypothetical protein
MCIAVIGNEGASGRAWRETAARAGFELHMVQPPLLSAVSRMQGLDALVIMADGVSREEQEEAAEIAALKGIPILCASCEGAVFCR